MIQKPKQNMKNGASNRLIELVGRHATAVCRKTRKVPTAMNSKAVLWFSNDTAEKKTGGNQLIS